MAVLGQFQTREFASEKIIKARMKSVGSIAKITKAMKMVSASKMRGDLVRLDNGREFGYGSIDMVFKSDTYLQRKQVAEASDPSELIVPITSDRGLCGAINSGIIRDIKNSMKNKNRAKTGIMSIGDKGAAGLQRPFPDCLKTAITGISVPYNYSTVMALAQYVTQESEGYDKVTIYYNQFVSAIAYEIRTLELMPKKKFVELMKFGHLYDQKLPDKTTSNPALYELYLTSNLWVAILNNAASEQSARMNAMENASKNAKEIVEALTLQYNKARQAKITMELCEIISGASAL
jgi:F-type H+-transporting ATPase subunit gamma